MKKFSLFLLAIIGFAVASVSFADNDYLTKYQSTVFPNKTLSAATKPQFSLTDITVVNASFRPIRVAVINTRIDTFVREKENNHITNPDYSGNTSIQINDGDRGRAIWPRDGRGASVCRLALVVLFSDDSVTVDNALCY